MIAAYYNDSDPYCCQWLRNLIAAGHIAPGDVDDRDIREVRGEDLKGYRRVHLFAGVGVWDYALRCAGWPDDRPIWTGSCPCQPFSAAGRHGGIADERHLWPEMFRLVRECRPDTIFGEQVASDDGLAWLDLVSADLEGEGYAFGAVDLCAAGLGAPHIRQRLWWVADLPGARLEGRREQSAGQKLAAAQRGSRPGGVADTSHGDGRSGECGEEAGVGPDGEWGRGLAGDGPTGGLADTRHALPSWAESRSLSAPPGPQAGGVGSHGPTGGMADTESRFLRQQETRNGRRGPTTGGPLRSFWRDADWLPCADGKARPVRPGTFPLAYGAPARVGRLRAYGNAISPQVAEAFVRAYMMECEAE